MILLHPPGGPAIPAYLVVDTDDITAYSSTCATIQPIAGSERRMVIPLGCGLRCGQQLLSP